MPDPLVLPRLGVVRRTVARSTTWWGRAFVRSLEEAAYDEADLAAGRALARSGRLGALMVLASMASVVVDPSGDHAGSSGPLMAQLKVSPLQGWAIFLDEAVRETGYVAGLESGQLPGELVEHADQAGAELLPGASELETACDCDAWAQPCRHAIALLYQLAWRIDADPYVLLLLRGRTREWFLEEVGARQDAALVARGSSLPHPQEAVDAGDRARQILALAEGAPGGHGLLEAAVYDEEVARLL